MSEQTIGIVGGGLMGHGIAYLLAAVGHKVAIYEPSAELRATLPQRLKAIAALLDDDPVLTEKISAHEALAPAMQGATFVFEAVPEKLPLKQQLFAEIERHVAADTVEVIQNEKTAADVVRKTMDDLLRDAGKVPVHIRRDVPGFVGNRLQHAMKREAIALVASGVCDAETIDTVVREGFGARTAVLGPMEQTDLVGVDLTLDIAEVLYKDLDATRGPHPFLREKVRTGKLGMKTGEGLRQWTPEQADAVRSRLSRFLAEQARARRKGAGR
jgi:3-hydroxybutyryl-CoA dehydrogenase